MSRGSISVRVEYQSHAGIEKDYSEVTTYSKVDNSISSSDETRIDGSVEAAYAGMSGTIKAAYGKIKNNSKASSETKAYSSTTMKEYDSSKFQVYRILTTSFMFPSGGFAESIARTHVLTTDKSSSEADLNKMSCDYMKTHYGVSSHKITIPFVENKYQKWVSIHRGQHLPPDAVFGGVYSAHGDGEVYVGRHSGVPGKINLENGKMWNCWVEGIGSSQSAEILTTNKEIDWVSRKKGDPIPEGVVGDMQTKLDGPVIVAKTHSNEIGKLNLDGNRLNNLWSHAEKKSTSYRVLTLR